MKLQPQFCAQHQPPVAVAELGPLIWLFLCQAGSKLFFRFFHGSSSDLAQWTVELAPAA
jgi:hypothetical protein